MTDPKIEAEAREAAYDYEQRRITFVVEHRVTTPAVVQIFRDGYLAGHASRDEEVAALQSKLTAMHEPLWMLREEHEAEIATLRARVAELEYAKPTPPPALAAKCPVCNDEPDRRPLTGQCYCETAPKS